MSRKNIISKGAERSRECDFYPFRLSNPFLLPFNWLQAPSNLQISKLVTYNNIQLLIIICVSIRVKWRTKKSKRFCTKKPANHQKIRPQTKHLKSLSTKYLFEQECRNGAREWIKDINQKRTFIFVNSNNNKFFVFFSLAVFNLAASRHGQNEHKMESFIYCLCAETTTKPQ